MNGPICDLLWADPLSEDVLGTRLTDKDYGEFMELDYLPNPGRGCSCLYGYAAISQILSNNDLLGIIRGHQCKEEGISFAYSNNRKILFPFPLVTTVFSAANYCGTYTNKGAVLVILNDELQVIKYTSSGETWVEDTPYCPPETETIPEIPEIITEESPETEDQPMPLLPEDEFRLRSGAIKKDSIGSRRRPNQRSLSISHHVSVPVKVSKRSTLRRKSMHMIKQGGTIEEGSEKFLSALKQDALHELHPGWNSVRRLAGVVG
jgi:serine/threonine-protein phosphatase 2B catalytic subunit